MKKRKGQIGSVTAMFLMLFVVVIIGVSLHLRMARAISSQAEDALAASLLASAVIDTHEYGRNHNILITDTDRAYEIYQDTLKYNMNLDDFWMSSNPTITGPVKVEEYIIYNVKGTDVTIHVYGDTQYTQTISGGLGTVTSPEGQMIQSTSIYSRITFPVAEPVAGINVNHTAMKSKLVDIVNN